MGSYILDGNYDTEISLWVIGNEKKNFYVELLNAMWDLELDPRTETNNQPTLVEKLKIRMKVYFR